MRVVFRVDASVEIGTGHVMRCLTLADRLAVAGADCRFIMREHPGHLIEQVRARGFQVVGLPPPDRGDMIREEPQHAAWLGVDPAVDAEQTAVAAEDGDVVDWLVVDHYALDAQWESRLRPHVRRVMVIDDLADRQHDCNLLLDQNLQVGAERYAGRVPDDCTMLIGPAYALLRREFLERRRILVRDAERPVRRLLVFLGGVDATGLTPMVLTAIETVRDAHLEVDVVVGATNPRSLEIAEWCATRSWVRPHIGNADMADLMAEADLAIGAGGTSTWERCALALPTLILTIAGNQIPGAEAVARVGAGLYLGDGAQVSPDYLAAALRVALFSPWLRKHMAAEAATLVDGLGTERVALRLLESEFILRRARPADCMAVWQWRNDESTRRHSHDSRPIDRESHQKWFDASLRAANRDLLIAEDNDDAVGVLRFDHAEGVATVSVYLVPGRAGRGQGTRLLRAGLKWIESERPETQIVRAEVLEQNSASNKAFARAGFVPFATTYHAHLGPRAVHGNSKPC